MADVIAKVLDLNRLAFDNGDKYNSESLLRAGIGSGKLVLLTEPARLAAKEPLRAYCVLKVDRRVLRLERIAVAPEHRNAGLGRALIARARKWRDRHFPGKPIWTYVNSDNVESLNAHVHAGFGIEAVSADWIWIMG